MTELKQCPFCGGIVGVRAVSYPDRKYYQVACMDKKCGGFEGLLNQQLFNTFGQAMRAWKRGDKDV